MRSENLRTSVRNRRRTFLCEVVGFTAVAALTVAGCTRDSEAFTATYQGIAAPGFIDQTVTFTFSASQARRVHLRYIPLGKDGAVLPNVSVTSAFGSDSGQLVVTKNSDFDILHFSGSASDEVADVRVEVIASAAVPTIDPQATTVEIARYASDGHDVDKFDVFDSVLLENPNPAAVEVRVVCLNYDDPSPGSSQQAIERIEVIDRATLAGGESRLVESSPAFVELARSRGYGCASVKSHFVP